MYGCRQTYSTDVTYRPRRSCRRCEQDRDECGGLSRSGLCGECGPIVYAESARQIAAHQGEHFNRYRDGLTDYVTRLWGESLTPEALAEVAESETRQEGIRWPVG